MSAQRDYYCNCARHCGTLQKVSRRTYFAHAQYRRDRLRSALGEYLAQQDPGPKPATGHHLEPGFDGGLDIEADQDEPDGEEMGDILIEGVNQNPGNEDAYDVDNLYADDNLHADYIPIPQPPGDNPVESDSSGNTTVSSCILISRNSLTSTIFSA